MYSKYLPFMCFCAFIIAEMFRPIEIVKRIRIEIYVTTKPKNKGNAMKLVQF